MFEFAKPKIIFAKMEFGIFVYCATALQQINLNNK